MAPLGWPQGAQGSGLSIAIEKDRQLHISASCGDVERVTKLLAASPWDGAASRDGEMGTPLHKACRTGMVAVAEALVKGGADIEARTLSATGELHTPLMVAAMYGQTPMVQWLLEHGAVVSKHDYGNKSALHFAAMNGWAEVVDALLEGGADATDTADNGFSALHYAAWRGHIEVARQLMARSRELVKQPGKHDWYTPLHVAAVHGHAELAAALLEAGADPAARDRKGKTARELSTDDVMREITNYAGRNQTPLYMVPSTRPVATRTARIHSAHPLGASQRAEARIF